MAKSEALVELVDIMPTIAELVGCCDSYLCSELVYVCVCVCVCLYVCMHACMYVCMCMCGYLCSEFVYIVCAYDQRACVFQFVYVNTGYVHV